MAKAKKKSKKKAAPAGLTDDARKARIKDLTAKRAVLARQIGSAHDSFKVTRQLKAIDTELADLQG